MNRNDLTGTEDRPILLVTVEPKNKSTENYLDSVQHNLDLIAMEFQKAGASNIENENARVYPNPAEDYVKIEVPANSSACRIDLLNCTGMLVKSVEFTGTFYTFQLSEITNGIYILRLTYNQKIESFKLIVE